MRQLAVAALALCVTGAACQSAPPAGDDDDGSGGPGDPDDPLIADYALTWGPVTVPASRESTQCVWLRLGNDTEIKVHQLHNALGPGSHHLIVYKDDMDTTEQTAPVPCQPFTGALNPTGRIFPIMITQKSDDTLRLPTHVAYTLAPHQMIKIEMHYLNATDAAIQATAKVTVSAADPAAIRDEANILFIGSPDIDLPINMKTELHQFFDPTRAQLDLTGAKFFAITGHTHALGLDVQVGIASAPTAPVTSVYAPAPFVWSEPETATHEPEFTLPDGGGFDFKCSYFNSTGLPVEFGESASDEMCFFWAYYYPSKGSHVCAHSNQLGFDLDLCCPEAGAALCNLLNK
jgi:hypothetical protein